MPRSKNKSKQKTKEAAEGDSRTAAHARKRLRATASETVQGPAPKRRRQGARNKPSTVGPDSQREFVSFSSLQNTEFAQSDGSMSVQNLGNNRLRSGFVNARRVQRSASHVGTPSDSDNSAASESEPMEYDLDTEDEDGGMTLNVQSNYAAPIVISDDEEETEGDEDTHGREQEESSLEEGEEREVVRFENATPRLQVEEVQRENQAQAQDEVHFVIDPTPSKSQVLLKDLSPEQLEEQLKYAFWQLERDQIDLSRPVRCLHCQSEGHVDKDCPQKTCLSCGAFGEHDISLCPRSRRCAVCRERGHSTCDNVRNTTIPCDLCSVSGHPETSCPLRHYPRPAKSGAEPIRLWISCCACASKSHLVGDCTKSLSNSAARWSLKALDPAQVVNLSAQTGIDKLEKDAQNRGMRPEGLKIRGRASQQHDMSRYQETSESDELENFLSHPSRSRSDRRRDPPLQPARHADQYRPTTGARSSRYDRFAAPNGPDSYRPPRNAFYATDSFGRPRSRSPPRHALSSGLPPPTNDAYHTSRRREPPGRRHSPPRQGAGAVGGAPGPSPGVSIQLPNWTGANLQARLPAKPPAPSGVEPKPSQPQHNKKKS